MRRRLPGPVARAAAVGLLLASAARAEEEADPRYLSALYVWNIAAGTVELASVSPRPDYARVLSPTWSPDGRTLAFAAVPVPQEYWAEWPGGVGEVWRLDVEPGVGPVGTARRVCEGSTPRFGPDGRLAVGRGTPPTIHLVDLDGGGDVALGLGGRPAWNADGTWMLVTHGANYPFAIRRLNVADGSVVDPPFEFPEYHLGYEMSGVDTVLVSGWENGYGTPRAVTRHAAGSPPDLVLFDQPPFGDEATHTFVFRETCVVPDGESIDVVSLYMGLGDYCYEVWRLPQFGPPRTEADTRRLLAPPKGTTIYEYRLSPDGRLAAFCSNALFRPFADDGRPPPDAFLPREGWFYEAPLRVFGD